MLRRSIGNRFPTEEIIKARGNGTLGEILPSGTEFPVTFSNGERNALVVGRDDTHTYLVTKYVMAEPAAMNGDPTNVGGWPACGMREHVHRIYDMLPEEFREAVIPMHIEQDIFGNHPLREYLTKEHEGDTVKECTDNAFLLSSTNVFGKDTWDPEVDLGDTQIDIFRGHENRVKRCPDSLIDRGGAGFYGQNIIPSASSESAQTEAFAAMSPTSRAA